MYLVTHFLTTPQQTDIFESLNHLLLTTSPSSSTTKTLKGFWFSWLDTFPKYSKSSWEEVWGTSHDTKLAVCQWVNGFTGSGCFKGFLYLKIKAGLLICFSSFTSKKMWLKRKISFCWNTRGVLLFLQHKMLAPSSRRRLQPLMKKSLCDVNDLFRLDFFKFQGFVL